MHIKDNPEIREALSAFSQQKIYNLLSEPLRSLALSKMRWVLTDFGVSPYRLPAMPIIDYILIADNNHNHLNTASLIDSIIYYRILAARNCLVVLRKAYQSSNIDKGFYDLSIADIFEAGWTSESSIPQISVSRILQGFNLFEYDLISRYADSILFHINPIIEMYQAQDKTCKWLISGSDKEKDILSAYYLYRILFPQLFTCIFSDSLSEESMLNKYHGHFNYDLLNEQIKIIFKLGRRAS